MDVRQAEEAFRNTPDLVERITLFLDPSFALCLAITLALKAQVDPGPLFLL